MYPINDLILFLKCNYFKVLSINFFLKILDFKKMNADAILFVSQIWLIIKLSPTY